MKDIERAPVQDREFWFLHPLAFKAVLKIIDGK